MALITIDPSDARDHDDAVYACEDTDESNPGGYVVTVAIADVSYYIPTGSMLDREALKRGNSVYFPDRVVPMLPEKISNDLCSLREHEERPCLAVTMRFDKYGDKIDHRFQAGHHALSRQSSPTSRPRWPLTAMAMRRPCPCSSPSFKPLWAAWRNLLKARAKRHPLELDLPERKIIMDDEGRIKDILTPERLEAHKVIEEFMIAANVCAAQTLDQLKSPRDLPHPSRALVSKKCNRWRISYKPLKIKFPRQAQIKARQLNDILLKVKDSEYT